MYRRTSQREDHEAYEDKARRRRRRPENGQFRPGTKFTEYYFDETGDTTATSVENDCCGGWGSVMKLTLSPSSDNGTLTMFYKSDKEHSGFDNVAFVS